MTPYERSLNKKRAKAERSKLKKALCDNSAPPKRCRKWYNMHRDRMLPQSWDVSLTYDCRVYPCKYLPFIFYINEVLEQQGFKLFQSLSLRNNVVPRCIMIDTTCMIDFLTTGNKGGLLKKVEENQESIWSQFFNLDLEIFKQKNYGSTAPCKPLVSLCHSSSSTRYTMAARRASNATLVVTHPFNASKIIQLIS